tara:strand:+ start:1259 stop:2080 length:822 start_codon:yes stop_codon:yes gene_type:complete
MIRVLIVGRKSFIGSNLYFFLKKKLFVKKISYDELIKKNIKFFKKYSYIINCSVHPSYMRYRYQTKFDNDIKIAKKIKNINIKYIFISSGKIYRSKFDIKENSLLNPKCNYSKNKLITEKKLTSIIKNRVLIFRVSNIIGLPIINNNKKIHWTFVDDFFYFANKGVIFNNGKNFKDFISIKKFSEIIYLSLKKNIYGIYNLSIGKKIYLNHLIKWLNFYNKNKCKVIKIEKIHKNVDNFTLNNTKLSKIINFKYSINDLEKYCRKISKIYFKK